MKTVNREIHHATLGGSFIVCFIGDMGVFSNAKDRVVEKLALDYLNEKLLGPYGRATRLRINSAAKTISITAELKGESSPLEIEIEEYEIGEESGRHFARIKRLQTSREWLTTLAREHLCGKRFDLPPEVGRMLVRAL